MEVSFTIIDDQDREWMEGIEEGSRDYVLKKCVSLGRLVFQSQSYVKTENEQMYEFFKSHYKADAKRMEAEMSDFMTKLRDTTNMSQKSVTEIESKIQDIKSEIRKTMEQQSQQQTVMFPQLMHNIRSLTEEIEKLTNIRSNSTLKGKLGEELISQNIQQMFPEWEMKQMTHNPHESDYHLIAPFGKILLEVKTYTNNVPKEQIAKFYRDIDNQNVRYALLVSTTSGIVGRKSMEFEKYRDTHVLYVSNAGLNGMGAYMGLLFIQTMDHIMNMSKGSIRVNTSRLMEEIQVQEWISTLYDMMGEYYTQLESLKKMKQTIGEQKKQSQTMYDELYKMALQIEIQSSSILARMDKEFKKMTECVKNTLDGNDQIGGQKYNTDEEIKQWIVENCKEEKKQDYYRDVLGVLRANGMEMYMDGGGWKCVMKGNVVMTILYAKTKMEIQYDLRYVSKKPYLEIDYDGGEQVKDQMIIYKNNYVNKSILLQSLERRIGKIMEYIEGNS